MDLSDADLMEQIREGDRRAFADLVERYKDPVVGYLSRLTADHGLAEDLAQETFIQLYTKAPAYREQGKLAGFLYRIASNLALSALRRRQRRRWLRRWFLVSSNGGPSPATPEGLLERDELRRLIGQAIADLPLRYRIPLVLHELQGLGYSEVARATGLAEGTVKSRVFRGRQLLKQQLSGHQPGGGADG